MSQALRTALMTRLTGDAALVALVGKDPADGTSPAIYDASKNQAPPVYDCLTYRIESAVPDKRFRPGLPGPFVSGVEDFYIDFEAWTQTPDSAPLDNIGARLDALLHQQSFPATTGIVFFAERVMRQADIYDKDLNCWASLSRFRLRFQQTS